jgi:hypothetical protein
VLVGIDKLPKELVYKAVEIQALHGAILDVLLFDAARLKYLCAWVLGHGFYFS